MHGFSTMLMVVPKLLCLVSARLTVEAIATTDGIYECSGGSIGEEKTANALLQIGREHKRTAGDTLAVSKSHHLDTDPSDTSDTETGGILAAIDQASNQTSNQTSDTEPDRECDKKALMDTVKDMVAKIGGHMLKESGASGLVNTLDKENGTVNTIVLELRNAARNSDGWLRLPPPEKGPLLWKMIRTDPWHCDLIPEGDRRRNTCELPPEDDSLDPHMLTCSHEDQCSVEHANSFRALYNIGAMPCCASSPFCAAPPCAPPSAEESQQPEKKEKKDVVCNKREPPENVAYLKNPDNWPAYHGWAGAFELDALKLLDMFACHNETDCIDKPFDLVLDIGANTGSYIEKFTVRNFAKNYIMIEANPNTAKFLEDRWMNESWKRAWFTDQVPHPGGVLPEFEIITRAVSNSSIGKIDMCATEESMKDTALGCNVQIATVDSLVPNTLSPNFKTHMVEAQSMFVKIDVEGMDELVLRGMPELLQKTRGKHPDGTPNYLVNFLQFEYAPKLMKQAKDRDGIDAYSIRTATEWLENAGFETFLMGPRYLPLSHGSWSEEFKNFPEDPLNNAGVRMTFPHFRDTVCPWCGASNQPSFMADVFAIRKGHPRAAELKVALGACKESKDFNINNPEYLIE